MWTCGGNECFKISDAIQQIIVNRDVGYIPTDKINYYYYQNKYNTLHRVLIISFRKNNIGIKNYVHVEPALLSIKT